MLLQGREHRLASVAIKNLIVLTTEEYLQADPGLQYAILSDSYIMRNDQSMSKHNDRLSSVRASYSGGPSRGTVK